MRRGDVSPVFKYILVTVVGAIFLIFFVAFAGNQIGIFTSLQDYESVFGFDDTLQTISVTESSELTLEPRVSTVFEFDYDKITIGESTKSTDKIVYAPSSVSGSEIYLSTQSWHYPFAAGNLFYVTDNNHQYIFLYDSGSEDIASDFTTSFDGFPSIFSFDVYEIEDALAELDSIEQAYTTKSLRFIFLTEPSSSEESAIDNAFDSESMIWIEFTDDENTHGYVHYEDSDEVFLGWEMLIGAMIIDDGEQYNFQFSRCIDKLISMCDLYEDKIDLLEAELTECSYTTVTSNLNTVSSYAEEGDDPFLFQSKMEDLTEANRALGGDCPKVF